MTYASERDEEVLWKGHPAKRATLWLWLLAVIVFGFAWAWHQPIGEWVSQLIHRMGITDSPGAVAETTGMIVLAIAALPALRALIAVATTRLTTYELTDQRLLIHSGLLLRRRSEVELFRMRDFKVKRPLHWLILGIGRIMIVTRDETTPTFDLGPVAQPVETADRLRRAMQTRKDVVGYRELETTF